MARWLPFVLVAFAVTVGAVLLWPDRAEVGAAAAPGAAPVHATPSSDAVVEPDSSAERRAPPAPAVVAAPPETAPSAAQSEPVEAASVTLRGTVTAIDADEVEHAAESGEMELTAWQDGAGWPLDVEVESGSWSCEVPGDARIEVSSATLGGRAAFWTRRWDESLAIPEERFLALRVRWPPASLLVVRAGDTGRELDGIELVSDFWFPEGDGTHPGRVRSRNVVEEAASSPVEIAVEPGRSDPTRTFFVRCPGYAWGKIEIDLSRGGERLLQLVPGGDLVVSFRGKDPAAGARLVLQSEGASSPDLELPLEGEGDTVSLESLPEGRYDVAVQIGHWFENHVRLGAGVVDVVAGTEAAVVLALEEGPELRVASLSGLLVIPEGWDIETPYLSFDLAGPGLGGRDDHFALYASSLEAVPGQPGVFAWRVPEAQVGKYEISVSEPPVSIDVELGPEGRDDVVLELPPAARVRLRVLEVGSERAADLQRVSWHPKRATNAGGWSSSSVALDEGSGLFEFTATEGEIEITIHAGDYQWVRQDFRVSPGVNELTLRVERATGVLVVLKDGDTLVPWDFEWHGFPERLDGAPGGYGMSQTDGGLRFTVPEGGLYRIVMPEIEGYLPVDALEVWIGTEQQTTVEVPLVRVH